jgi:hypothetical protein
MGENRRQAFWIEIAYGTRHWYIRPARGGVGLPTAGVQRALDLVRDAVRQPPTRCTKSSVRQPCNGAGHASMTRNGMKMLGTLATKGSYGWCAGRSHGG